MASRSSGVSTRTLWFVVIGMAVLGIVILLVLGYVWRTARVPGVRSNISPEVGELVAYAGIFPAGGGAPLVAPRSISHDGSRVYVTQPDAGRVSVFTLAGAFVRTVDVVAAGSVYPIDAVALGDTLYVVDATGRRLLALPVDGGEARTIAPELEEPTALAVENGTILVADASSGLWRFDPVSGELARIASEQATKGYTGGMAPHGDRVLLTDSGGSRVLDVALAGGDIRTFGERVSLPRGIAVDGAGRVWVADVFGGTVIALDEDGNVLGDIENEDIAGSTAVELGTPQGVVYEPSESRLYVVDAQGGRIVIYAVAR